MPDVPDALRSLRERIASLEQRAGRPAEESDSRQGWAGRVFDGGDMPATTPAVYLVKPAALDGGREEGDAVSATAGGEPVPVLVLGAVPAEGRPVNVTRVADWWVAHVGVGGVTACAPCPLPARDLLLRADFDVNNVGTGWEQNGLSVALKFRAQTLNIVGSETLGPVYWYTEDCLQTAVDPAVPPEEFVLCEYSRIVLGDIAGPDGCTGFFIGGGSYNRPELCDELLTFGPPDELGEHEGPISDPEGGFCGNNPLGWTLESYSCSPLCLRWTKILGGVQLQQIVVTDPTDPPDTEKQVCVAVRDCPGGAGSPVAGATVEALDETDVVVTTETTDAEGEACLPIALIGRYTIRVTKAGCEVSRPVSIVYCSPNPTEIEFVLCCGVARVTVRDALTDAALPTGQVRVLPDGEWLDADGSGRVAIELTTAQMVALPQAEGSCTTRLLSVEARSTSSAAGGYLNYCTTVPVECASTTAAPTESDVPVEPLDRDGDGLADFVPAPAGFCAAGGCAVPGPAGRGLVGTRLDVVAEAELYGDDSAWHPILGSFGGSSAPVEYAVNGTVDGTASGSPWEANPDTPLPDVEYGATGTASFTPLAVVTPDGEPSDCGSAYDGAQGWLRRGLGLVVRLEGSGTGTQTVPGPSPIPCPGSVEFLDIYMEFEFDPCVDALPYFFDSGWVVVSGGAGGRDYRYRVQGTLS